MSKLRSRLSGGSAGSYNAFVFTDASKHAKPIYEVTTGSVSVDTPNPVEEKIEIKDEFKDKSTFEFHGFSSGEERQVSKTKGSGEQKIISVSNEEVSGSLVEGSEILGSKAGQQLEGEQTGSYTTGSGLHK